MNREYHAARLFGIVLLIAGLLGVGAGLYQHHLLLLIPAGFDLVFGYLLCRIRTGRGGSSSAALNLPATSEPAVTYFPSRKRLREHCRNTEAAPAAPGVDATERISQNEADQPSGPDNGNPDDADELLVFQQLVERRHRA